MKKIRFMFIAFAFCCRAFLANAQSDTGAASKPIKGKIIYEAGFNMYSLIIRPGDFNTSYKRVFDYQHLSGVYLKMHHGRNALRFGMQYSKREMWSQGNFFNRYSEGTVTSFETKLGYQRTFTKKRFGIYGFVDLEYAFLKPRSTYNGYPYFSSDYEYFIAPYPYPDRHSPPLSLNGHLICLSPGVGFRWKIGSHLALGFEAAAQLFYAKTKAIVYTNHRGLESVGVNVKAAAFTIGFIF